MEAGNWFKTIADTVIHLEEIAFCNNRISKFIMELASNYKSTRNIASILLGKYIHIILVQII
mgnify:CR=1 FL=1